MKTSHVSYFFFFFFFFFTFGCAVCSVIFGVVFSVFFFLLSQSLDKQRVVEEPVYILKVLTHTATATVVVHVHRHVIYAHKGICATLWTQ